MDISSGLNCMYLLCCSLRLRSCFKITVHPHKVRAPLPTDDRRATRHYVFNSVGVDFEGEEGDDDDCDEGGGRIHSHSTN